MREVTRCADRSNTVRRCSLGCYAVVIVAPSCWRNIPVHACWLRLGEADDSLGRCDDQPPGRGVCDLAGLGMFADHCLSLAELVGRLQGENLDSRKPAFGQVGQRPGRWDLDQGRSEEHTSELQSRQY